MQGVESAAVMYDEHSEQGLSNERVVKTASVFIKPQGNDELADERIPAIRNFVAGAIGCKPTDITVIDQNSGRSFAGGASGGGDGADSGYLATKRRYETNWEGQIRKALGFIPHVAVTVNVELNRETEEEKHEVKVDPKVIPLDVKEKNHSSTTTIAERRRSAGPEPTTRRAQYQCSGRDFVGRPEERRRHRRAIRKRYSLTNLASIQDGWADSQPRHRDRSVC